MNRDRNRRTMGIVLITVGLLGLIISLTSFTMWSYSMLYTGPMVGRWNYGEMVEISGTVDKTEWMEIELKVDGEEVEVHGPPWFWQRIGIKEGDAVSVKGIFVSMMDSGEGRHEELIPFELTANSETYGNASKEIPVWMQG